MDRRAWLEERRAAVEADYDKDASDYDRTDPGITPVHARFVQRLLDTCPPAGTLLDVPCGTGKYFEEIRDAGRRVVGVDQSAGMLAVARAKGIASALHQTTIQALDFVAEFDGAMTVDAMENVPPEDWPLVLATLHSAVRPGAHLYLTVEELEDDSEIEDAFASLTARGLPAVRGEVIEGDVAGYHYYPGRERVLGWLDAEGLEIVEEDFNQEEGWGYRHFLVRGTGRG